MELVKRRRVGRPFQPNNPGRPKGALNKTTRDIQQAARAILESPEYVAALKQRLVDGTAGAMEPLMHYYGYGKPKETIAHEIPMRPLVVDLLEPGDVPPDGDG